MRLIDRFHKPLLSSRNSGQPAGAVLIALIIAITLIATLGVAMYTLSSSDSYSTLSANLSMRAFYAAESGYRYAASEYGKAADMDAKISRMETLHDPNADAPWTLPNGLGTFSLENHPYFFITTTWTNAGGTDLEVRTPGEFPPGFTVPDGAPILIGGEFTPCPTGTNALIPPNNILFRIPGGLPSDLPAGSVVYLVAEMSVAPQNMTAGGPLALTADAANFFPPKNGRIEAAGHVFSYEICEVQGSETILSNIQGVDADAQAALPLPVSFVILRPMVHLVSTGKVADGLLGGSRESTYIMSITDEILSVSGGPGGGGP